MSSHRLDQTYGAAWFGFARLVARFLPRRALASIGTFAGASFARTHPVQAEVVRRNLALIDQPVEPCELYAEFGRTLADYFYAGSRSRATALALVDERLGFEYLREAAQAGKGALLLTPHLSFFELGSVVMQEFGFPMMALTDPEPSPALTRWRAEYRRRWGVSTLALGADQFQFVEIARHLRCGTFVAALFDRPHPSQSFSARVPGGLLACSSGILLLALLGDCPVIPVTVVRKSNGKYRLSALEPIRIQRRGSSAETLQHYTQMLVDAVLPTIRAHASQWFQFAPLDPR
jgi:KDO2-lipid IV(A) lauroyltransferase